MFFEDVVAPDSPFGAFAVVICYGSVFCQITYSLSSVCVRDGVFVRGGKFHGQKSRLNHDYQPFLKTVSRGSAPVLSIGEGGHAL